MPEAQGSLFEFDSPVCEQTASTFVDNLKLPVHRWFRYSAGFSAEWVESVIAQQLRLRETVRVLDPFAGSGTTLVAAEDSSVSAYGIEAHPFVVRIAEAKLAWRSDPDAYWSAVQEWASKAEGLKPDISGYPPLIQQCFSEVTLEELDKLRQSYELLKRETPAWKLVWLTLVSILRPVSRVGTAQWQYVLPKKEKRAPLQVRAALARWSDMVYADMKSAQFVSGPEARVIDTDARTCQGVPDHWANLVITSPPYPNNYDYADATRLEMSFMREISGWGDLQQSVRKHLIRSCSQHVPERSMRLDDVLASPELEPIGKEIREVCRELAAVRQTRVGKKTYHLMIACYFRDLARVWNSLRRVAAPGATVCFVVGDSAPYGVYVPVVPWLGQLALASGFHSYRFEKTRDRNLKWKNRKHRVPLQEGRLWVEG